MSSRNIIRLDGEGEVAKQGPTENGQIVLVIDCSNSMENGKLSQAKEGAADFARKAFLDQNEVGVICFAFTPTLLQEPTSDSDMVYSAVQEIRLDGGTDIAAGIRLGIRVLRGTGRRTIVLVTDGMPWPNNSKTRADTIDAADEARLEGIDIVCIGTDDADLDFLRKLATLNELAKHVCGEDLKKELVASYDLLKLLLKA